MCRSCFVMVVIWLLFKFLEFFILSFFSSGICFVFIYIVMIVIGLKKFFVLILLDFIIDIVLMEVGGV